MRLVRLLNRGVTSYESPEKVRFPVSDMYGFSFVGSDVIEFLAKSIILPDRLLSGWDELFISMLGFEDSEEGSSLPYLRYPESMDRVVKELKDIKEYFCRKRAV